MFKEKVKGFIAGAIVSVLLVGSLGIVFAKQGTEMLEAIFRDIKIVVDGNGFTPKVFPPICDVLKSPGVVVRK